MMRYSCLIRSDSNYSIIAEKLGNYGIVIYPIDMEIVEGKTRIIAKYAINRIAFTR